MGWYDTLDCQGRLCRRCSRHRPSYRAGWRWSLQRCCSLFQDYRNSETHSRWCWHHFQFAVYQPSSVHLPISSLAKVIKGLKAAGIKHISSPVPSMAFVKSLALPPPTLTFPSSCSGPVVAREDITRSKIFISLFWPLTVLFASMQISLLLAG